MGEGVMIKSEAGSFRMTRVDWRWAAKKGFWDKERKCWIEAAGGQAAYILQRTKRCKMREQRVSRQGRGLDRSAPPNQPYRAGISEELSSRTGVWPDSRGGATGGKNWPGESAAHRPAAPSHGAVDRTAGPATGSATVQRFQDAEAFQFGAAAAAVASRHGQGLDATGPGRGMGGLWQGFSGQANAAADPFASAAALSFAPADSDAGYRASSSLAAPRFPSAAAAAPGRSQTWTGAAGYGPEAAERDADFDSFYGMSYGAAGTPAVAGAAPFDAGQGYAGQGLAHGLPYESGGPAQAHGYGGGQWERLGGLPAAEARGFSAADGAGAPFGSAHSIGGGSGGGGSGWAVQPQQLGFNCSAPAGYSHGSGGGGGGGSGGGFGAGAGYSVGDGGGTFVRAGLSF